MALEEAGAGALTVNRGAIVRVAEALEAETLNGRLVSLVLTFTFVPPGAEKGYTVRVNFPLPNVEAFTLEGPHGSRIDLPPETRNLLIGEIWRAIQAVREEVESEA